MKKRIFVFMAVLPLLGMVQVYGAQSPSQKPSRISTVVQDLTEEDDSQPQAYYRLDFLIRELEGDKIVDTRNYSLWVREGSGESMTAGSEVPYYNTTFLTSGTGTTKSVNYRNIGVRIDCVIKQVNGNPGMDLKLNISDVIPPQKESDSPAFRSINLNSNAMLSSGKPVTVGIVEDPASRHRYQVDVTATRLR